MSNQVASFAQLAAINSALASISKDIRVTHLEIGTLQQNQHHFENELEKLSAAFSDFVATDVKHKALQLAETRVGNFRQELQIRFGYYGEVRKMATGILQGADTGLVSDTSLQLSTEEVMIKAPGYWLAPALIVIAGWLRNDTAIAEKALTEAIRRNDYKTTLFFMLIMRRLERKEASIKWLERYFLHQSPHALNREFILILEGITLGVFSPAARQLMDAYVKEWLATLTNTEHFVEEQKRQWKLFFLATGARHQPDYPLLEKYAGNWTVLRDAAQQAASYELLCTHFREIFQPVENHSPVVQQLDILLDKLVTDFDDEELPLREQVRFNECIIEANGDVAEAQKKTDAEKNIFHEQVDFLQLLTNAAFNPELAGASRATQALSIATSQSWIVEELDTFIAANRLSVPVNIELSIDGFSCQTRGGENEYELLEAQKYFYDQLRTTRLKSISFPYIATIIAIAIAGGAVSSLSTQPLVACILFILAGLVFWNGFNTNKQQKNKIIETIAEQHNKASEVLRGCLAEATHYRHAYSQMDTHADDLRTFLSSIKASEYAGISRDTTRNILT